MKNQIDTIGELDAWILSKKTIRYIVLIDEIVRQLRSFKMRSVFTGARR